MDIIAATRNSEVLRDQLTGTAATEPPMTLEQAYKLLGVSEDLENEHLIAQYEMNVKESPTQMPDFQRALRVIADKRDSYDIRGFLNGQAANSHAEPKQIALTEPRAIKNIGNTCYLNSLLQYLFTIRPLRDLVANIQQYGENPESSNLASKIVGDTKVTRAEVRRALTCTCMHFL